MTVSSLVWAGERHGGATCGGLTNCGAVVLSGMAKPFYAPKSLGNTLACWRSETRIKAIGAITYRGGTISGKELGAILGVSPRALRNLLIRDGHFLVEYRSDRCHRDEAWYRIKPEAMTAPEKLPPLRRAALPDGGKAPRVTYRGQPTPAVERFMAPSVKR